jgi:hypothetical protein
MHFFEALIEIVGDLLIVLVPTKKNRRSSLTYEPLLKPKFQQPITPKLKVAKESLSGAQEREEKFKP